ncbi:LysM peptidoglycan-binding domain-containing protein [Moraxella pluranimalium]|uniref:Lytic transglycosylase n=1 Tax=Moraxella pluranimalium TaxID=470453 RepID=A0A1T0CR01_9GAMM|nr:LysM peptidoglycan-binding domain-containing protein [Moraxella pluranimalium]OOS24581.1 lytic transglycosylase [Moraxella pluranimalium]
MFYSTQSLKAPRLLKPLSIAISSCILVACSSTGTVSSSKPTAVVTTKPQTTRQQPQTSSGTYTGVLDAELLDAMEDLLQATDMSMVEGDELAVQRYGNLWDRVRRGYRMSEVNNARIEAQKSWFYSRQSYLNRLTARASRYLHHTVAEAERRGIPTELALLPIIESSYDPTATSNAAAAGLWQFIPSTGRIYGLNQSSSYDGRRDVIESTRAAYDFLTSLYNQFGSWELALAAYNAGPGRISKAIRANQEQGLPTDYWSLKLPTETMNYVPRFIAVSQIVKSPNSYGIDLPAIANHSHFRTVPVNYGVSLSEVSSLTGVSIDELKLLNPALLSQSVDEIGPNRIVIPDSLPSSIDAKLSALRGFGFGGDYVATAPAQSIDYVVPKSGAAANNQSQQELILANTLPTTIAQVTENNTIIQEPALSQAERDFIAAQIQADTKNQVQAINPTDGNIELNAVQTGQSVLDARGETKTISFAGSTPKSQPVVTPQLPPAQNHTQPAIIAETQINQPQVQTTPNTTPTSFNDGSTDNLSNTAFQASVQTQNQTQSQTQVSAQTPTAPKPQAQPKPVATPKPTPKPATKPESYTVRTGDSLTSVAAANGLTVGQLASYNNLPVDSHIFVGQKLWLVSGKVKPQQTPAPTRTQSAPANNSSTTSSGATHKVVAGESLTAIARKYNVSLQALAAENGLSVTDNVLIGQVLKLPNGANVSTAQSQAQASNTAKQATTPKAVATATANNRATDSYTVKAGESLTAIANRSGVSVQELASLNGLSPTANLLIGQRIKIPKTTTTYTVKAGDGLISLARRYGISAAELAKMNNLEPNTSLRIGQVLTVPNK